MSLGSPLLKSVIFSIVRFHFKNRSNCYTNKPHHLPSQSRLFPPEAKPICTSPIQRNKPTAQLASAVQTKRKCSQNNTWGKQGVQQARWEPWLLYKSYSWAPLAFYFSWFVCLTTGVPEQPAVMLEQTSKNRSGLLRYIPAAWENNTNKSSSWH